MKWWYCLIWAFIPNIPQFYYRHLFKSQGHMFCNSSTQMFWATGHHVITKTSHGSASKAWEWTEDTGDTLCQRDLCSVLLPTWSYNGACVMHPSALRCPLRSYQPDLYVVEHSGELKQPALDKWGHYQFLVTQVGSSGYSNDELVVWTLRDSFIPCNAGAGCQFDGSFLFFFFFDIKIERPVGGNSALCNRYISLSSSCLGYPPTHSEVREPEHQRCSKLCSANRER